MAEVNEYLKWLRGQVGRHESPRGSNRTPYAAMAGHLNGFAWCATFVTAGANQVGLLLPDGANTASCYANEIAFKRAGRLSSTPHVGSVFFVYFPSMSRVAHTGVVWKVGNGVVHTIEGNTNTDGSREGYEVAMRVRSTHRSTGFAGIRSYGMPYYGEDIVNAADKRDIAEEAADLAAAKVLKGIRAMFLTDRFVPNQKVQPDDKAAADMTVVGCLSNVELNQDQQTRQDEINHHEVMTALAKLTPKSVTLNQK